MVIAPTITRVSLDWPLRFGVNTVSSPSVLAVRREAAPRFDEELVWLMDVEYYHRCKRLLGSPAIIPEALVVNRLHALQVSESVTPALKRHELRYVLKKDRDIAGLGDRLRFARRYLSTWR